MTLKTTLNRWADGLGADYPANPTAKDLESAIETAIAKPAESADEPQYSLREGIRNNWAVLKAEAIPTVKAIAANLRG